MINYYLDCEFNGFNGELISLALVNKSKPSFYKVLPLPEVINPWVKENVIPILIEKPLESKQEFTTLFHQYVLDITKDEICINADSFQDFIYFLEYFKGDTYQNSLYVRNTMNFKLLDTSGVTINSIIRHNALSDARALMMAFEDDY